MEPWISQKKKKWAILLHRIKVLDFWLIHSLALIVKYKRQRSVTYMQSVQIQAATLFHMQFHETIHLLSVASDEMSARGWSLLHEVVSPRNNNNWLIIHYSI